MTLFHSAKKKALCLITFALTGFHFIGSAEAGLVGNFSDINLWAGAGSNQSALVLQWNDGGTPTSLAWGFRWDGSVTGVDMLTAIAGNVITVDAGDVVVSTTSTGFDSRLTLTLKDYGWGIAVEGIAFSDGSYDRSAGGWSGGYWAYSVFGGDFEYDIYDTNPPYDYLGTGTYDTAGSSNYGDVVWYSSPIGALDRLLVADSWDGWSFDADFSGAPAIVQPYDAQAVPEPSSLLLLVVGTLFVVQRFRRKCRAQASL